MDEQLENSLVKEDVERDKADTYPALEFVAAGVYKQRQGKPVYREQKMMAYNVYSSHINRGENKSKSVKSTALETGLSERSVWSIIKEREMTGTLVSPTMKKSRPQAEEKLNEEQKNALRQIVQTLLLKNEDPTLNKIIETMRENETLPSMGRTTLSKVLRKLGFKYKKRGKISHVNMRT